MRQLLDHLYRLTGAIAAVSILGICLVVSAQVMLNILARLGGPSLSFTIPSYADFAGYLLSTASFMALAYTLRQGSHIRVNLFVQRMAPRPKWIFELTTLSLSVAMTCYATWYAVGLLLESIEYGDTSTGIVAIALWIPQSAMVAGLCLLTVAFIDTLVESLIARKPVLIDNSLE